MTAYWTGKKRGPMNQEWKDKISVALKEAAKKRPEGNKNNLLGTNRVYSIEGRLRMNKAHIGRKLSEEHKKKLSIAGSKYVATEETKKRLSLCKTGEKNPSWKGGVSKLKHVYSYTRKLRLRQAPGKHTNNDWELLKKQYGHKCPCCNKCEPEIKLTKDHIIPIVKGGSNFIENIQPLCSSCNRHKQTKIVKYALYIEKEK